MISSFPFRPLTRAAQRLGVADTVIAVTLPDAPRKSLSVWVENRGSSELLLELGAVDPDDALSFSIPAQTSQPIGVGSVREIRLKRPAGSAEEAAVVTAGEGM